MNDTIMPFCPSCKAAIVPGSKFCQNCGKLLEDFTHVGIGKQIYIYAVSLLAPPLGLMWLKYLKNPNQQIRNVGIAALILTVLSTILTIWFAFGFINTVQSSLSQYSNLGY